MKKSLAIILSGLVCACCMAGCGDDSKSDDGGAIGDKCTANKECQSNNCDMSNPDADGKGVCAAKVDDSKLADGKDCKVDTECNSGWCKGDATKKVCTAKIAKDQECTGFENYCASNLECKDDGGVKKCLESSSDVKKEIGGSCKIHAECNNSYCKKAEDAEPNDEGVCTALVADGQPCSANIECEHGICNFSSPNDPGVCGSTATGGKAAYGEPCNVDDDCQSNNCEGITNKTCGNVNPCAGFVSHCENVTEGETTKVWAYRSCSANSEDSSQADYDKVECKDETPSCSEADVANEGVAKCVVANQGGNCFYHEDCASTPETPFCGDDYKCRALQDDECVTDIDCIKADITKPHCGFMSSKCEAHVDPCQNATGGSICVEDDDLCSAGICYTTAMKTKADAVIADDATESCDANFNDFCYGDYIVRCENGTVKVENCGGINDKGSCTAIRGTGQDYDVLVCSGHPDEHVLKFCKELKVAEAEMCYFDEGGTANKKGNTKCMTDVSHDIVAVLQDAQLTDCNGCDVDGENAIQCQ